MPQFKLIFVSSLMLLIGITIFERINQPSENSFVAVPLPDEIEPDKVVVTGLLDCPNSGPETRNVMSQLTAAQIPYKHITSFRFTNTDDWLGLQRLNEIIKRGAPVVFVHGKAKANPTPEEVIAEYRQRNR